MIISIGITQVGTQRKMLAWGAKTGVELFFQQLWNYIKCSNICVIIVPEAEREQRGEEIFGK